MLGRLVKDIKRKRLIIEAVYEKGFLISESICHDYLTKLSKMLGMTIILGPIVKSYAGKINEKHDGYEAIIVWLESGVQLYTWKRYNFLTIDVYSCKDFSEKAVLDFSIKELKIVDYDYQVI